LKQSKRKTRNSKRPPGRSSAPPARRAPRARPARDTSTPQIRTGYAPAGRDTLAAIAEELGPDGPANVRPRDSDPGPEIEIAQTPAGRETIAAISEELAEQVSKEATSATLRDKAEPRSAAGHRGRTAAALPHRVGGRQLPDRSGASDAGSTPPPRPRMRTVGFSDPPPAAPDGPGSAERSGTGSKRRQTGQRSTRSSSSWRVGPRAACCPASLAPRRTRRWRCSKWRPSWFEGTWLTSLQAPPAASLSQNGCCTGSRSEPLAR
jgi:hypothetical protein